MYWHHTNIPGPRWLVAPLLLFLVSPLAGQGVSVALSDNLAVLDERNRSTAIELVNLGADPTEFRLTVDPDIAGTDIDGRSVIRWSPSRALAAPHTTVPVRIAVRPPADLPPGEYMLRAGVTAEVQRPPPIDTGLDDAPPDGIAVTIPVVPTLPIMVYFRHRISPPMIDSEPLVLTPDDADSMGYFPVVKRHPEYSFVGQVQVVDADSRQVINGGRLHLKPGSASSQVRMPRPAEAIEQSGRYCLLIWDHWPAQGPAQQEVCGS